MPLDHGGDARAGARADGMMGDHAIQSQRVREQKLAHIHIDTEQDPPHLAVDVHLRVGGGRIAAGQLVREGHDLAQAHGCDYAGFRMEGGFAPTFKEAVGRWRRRHRHPPANETWFAVHYRVGWLVERLSLLESIHLLRQGLDVRSLSAERPARRKKGDPGTDELHHDDDGGLDVEDEPSEAVTSNETGRPAGDGG